ARLGDLGALLRSGTGSTAAGTASEELDALAFDARREPTVAFLVGPGVVAQTTDDEDGITALQFAGRFCQGTPDGHVDVAGALLVTAASTAVALVHGAADARAGAAVGRVTMVGVTRVVADDHLLVAGVTQTLLALGIDDRCV